MILLGRQGKALVPGYADEIFQFDFIHKNTHPSSFNFKSKTQKVKPEITEFICAKRRGKIKKYGSYGRFLHLVVISEKRVAKSSFPFFLK